MITTVFEEVLYNYIQCANSRKNELENTVRAHV